MVLEDLKGKLVFGFDFADTQIDATFYTEIEDILPSYAKKIKVEKISKNFVICDFTAFIQSHKTAIKKYIYDNYSLCWASWLYNGLFVKDEKRKHFQFDDEAYYHFITKDLGEFLINEPQTKTYKQKQEEARQKAINWQHEASERCLSYAELAEAGEHFRKLAKRYGLQKEFAENGIV